MTSIKIKKGKEFLQEKWDLKVIMHDELQSIEYNLIEKLGEKKSLIVFLRETGNWESTYQDNQCQSSKRSEKSDYLEREVSFKVNHET